MTELDPVRVAREAVANNPPDYDGIWPVAGIMRGERDSLPAVAWAILGARAMQAASSRKGFEQCVFDGPAPAPFRSWGEWAEAGMNYRFRNVRIQAISWPPTSPAGPQEAVAARHDAVAKAWLADPAVKAAVHGATPAPAADVAGLVERARVAAFCMRSGETIQEDGDFIDALASTIVALQAEVERLRGYSDDLESQLDEQIEGRKKEWSKHGGVEIALGQWKARATAAEAEVVALRERNAEHEARFDAETSRADHYKAEAAALRAEVEQVKSDREFFIGWNDGWEEATKQNLRFPTMLRKMWSGSEVQAWIDNAMAEARSALGKAESPADTKAER